MLVSHSQLACGLWELGQIWSFVEYRLEMYQSHSQDEELYLKSVNRVGT